MTTSSPHDALVRDTFSVPEHAAGHLRAALPPAVADRIDWGSLELEPGEFIEPDLTAQYTDLLYSAKLGDNKAFFFLLYEHQSYGDDLMPFRMLRYAIAILKRWLDAHEGAKRIPMILGVVVSHVPGGWRWPTSMAQVFDVPEEVGIEVQPLVPQFRIVVDDLTMREDEELMSRVATTWSILVMLALRHIRDEGGLACHLGDWAELVRDVFASANGHEALGKLIRYALLAHHRTTMQNLSDALVPILGEGGREVVMTEGERLIEQGKTEGRAEGRAEGRVEGHTEGRAASVLAVLNARGMNPAEHQREQIMACTDIPTLDRWIVRAATAASVDAVFAAD